MRNITFARYWALAILLCSTFLFNGCKKGDNPDPEPKPVESALEKKIKEVAGSIARIDLSDAKVIITYGDDYNTGNTGPKTIIKPKEDLTIELLGQLLSDQIRYFDTGVERTQPLITLTRLYYLKSYSDASTDGVMFQSVPAKDGKPAKIIFKRYYVVPYDFTSVDKLPAIWSAEITL